MATVNKIQDNNGVDFEIEDSTARTEIGDLENLQTQKKSNLVAAINEIFQKTFVDVTIIDEETEHLTLRGAKLGRICTLQIGLKKQSQTTDIWRFEGEMPEAYRPAYVATPFVLLYQGDAVFNGQMTLRPDGYVGFYSTNPQILAGRSIVATAAYITAQ